MDTGRTRNALSAAALAAVCLALGFLGGNQTRPPRITERVDTLTVRDTVTIERPVPVLTTVIDTILVPYPDIVFIHDTTFVKLPKESKEYSGKDFRAIVSGFQPSLDLIQVFPETRTVTQTISAPSRKWFRWSVGVQAGYGITIRDNHVAPAPYLGLGVSYSLIQIREK